MTLDANKDLVRRVIEELFPVGSPTGVRDLVAVGFVDHDPIPGQPAGLEGIDYVVATLRA